MIAIQGPSDTATCEATPEILCQILGSPIQGRHGHTRESPMKGHEGDEETEASLL